MRFAGLRSTGEADFSAENGSGGIEAHSTVAQVAPNAIVSLAAFYSASDQIEHIVGGLTNSQVFERWVRPDS